MAEERRALVDVATNKVVNVIVYDSAKSWSVPSGTTMLSISDSLTASIGDTWNGTTIIKSEVTVADKYTNSVINTGSYIGDNTADRGITHGLKIKPKIVWLQTIPGKAFMTVCAAAVITPTSETTGPAIKAADVTNFYVGNALNLSGSANESGYTYYWVAIG